MVAPVVGRADDDTCGHCLQPIPDTKRFDAVYCSRECQDRARFLRAYYRRRNNPAYMERMRERARRQRERLKAEGRCICCCSLLDPIEDAGYVSCQMCRDRPDYRTHGTTRVVKVS